MSSCWRQSSQVKGFQDRIVFQKPLEPGLGVLAHVTSMPIASGQRSAFESVRSFIDGLASAGMRYWQILPLNPTDEYGSPYAGVSGFAGNVRLLGQNPEEIVNRCVADEDAYQEFCTREAAWLEPYACFMACCFHFGVGRSWQDWPEPYRSFDPQLVADDDELAVVAESHRRGQFAFDLQWSAVRAYAHDCGVQIIGDIPIYVSAVSADVWERPWLFQLDERGRPVQIAGYPPDDFSLEGQVWNNPVYDWNAHEQNGFDWWVRRLKRSFELYDVVRLDHFIGFERYYSIPTGASASNGTFCPGPGIRLFKAAFEKLGSLPVIAEDLGFVTPEVRTFIDACGFPGMDVLQFANDPLAGYHPRSGAVAYTGTHDNQTLIGFVKDRYPDRDEFETADRLMRAVASSDASIRIVPLQDLMMLGDEARMNVPGVAQGNWTWRADAADMNAAFARARSLADGL